MTESAGPPSSKEAYAALTWRQREVEQDAVALRGRIRLSEACVTVISLASGSSLFALITQDRTDLAAWIGAAASLLTAILSGYLQWGPLRKLPRLEQLNRRMSQAIARFKNGEPFGWSEYKDYWNDMLELQVIRPPSKKEWDTMSPDDWQRWESSYPQ